MGWSIGSKETSVFYLLLTINEREEVNEPDAVRHDRVTMVRLDNSTLMHAVKIHGVI